MILLALLLTSSALLVFLAFRFWRLKKQGPVVVRRKRSTRSFTGPSASGGGLNKKLATDISDLDNSHAVVDLEDCCQMTICHTVRKPFISCLQIQRWTLCFSSPASRPLSESRRLGGGTSRRRVFCVLRARSARTSRTSSTTTTNCCQIPMAATTTSDLCYTRAVKQEPRARMEP